ncbi:FadR/GntR family transcriptional regulator [Agromyces atrinae]|uniref:FadR family transcriptional regulator n=1 Tax=Agromyces atrinae TaxID=592376 RepID=A0A4Q2M6E9_9MICO|nr:FadR/GntR family transcriptional regulator [Agromyces atrinae]NYD68800.1 DNA-binding FadR family transcriptional regulator [Agromyces atrinae]RXZ85096.1 FadR family transcriptional regulator [Agromyces atrinae]RXZ85823.1 FadR family transcriptional regulator [Agromyces atrinae]
MSSRLHSLVIENLGTRIVSGELAPGTSLHTDSIEEALGVSRSVVREAVRVLQSLGLVKPVPRLGLRIRPRADWNVFDPEIIRWRIASEQKGAQLRSLTELRAAVEPAAAELAARHSPDDIAAELMAVAARMRAVGRSGDLQTFLELDIQFHSLVLAASGNEMFSHLRNVIGEVLRGRTDYGLMPDHPHEEALQLHVDVANAIQSRDPDAARTAMDRIMRRTIAEVEQVWLDTPREH